MYYYLYRKYTELTEKYRDLLDKSNNLVVHKETTAGYESEVKRLDSANSELTAQLEIEKEKLHTLEAAFEHMRKQGKDYRATRKKTNTYMKHFEHFRRVCSL